MIETKRKHLDNVMLKFNTMVIIMTHNYSLMNHKNSGRNEEVDQPISADNPRVCRSELTKNELE